MAPLPKPINHTVDSIYRAYAAARASSYEGIGISISNLGDECDRALYYSFRWASPQEPITGLKAIVFETGDIEEERLLTALRMIGCEVVDADERGKQFRYSAVNGHVRGKCDAKVLGVIEAPKTWHMAECKSMQEKYFKPVVKKGVKEGYLSHWVQCNTYAYLEGFDRCLYICRNKNTGEVYVERWETDREDAMRRIARVERIIYSDTPPPKLHEDPKAKVAFKCGFCRHRHICHENAFPRVHCRTCIHAAPEQHGDAQWSCARWAKPLGTDEQRAGCGAHLFVPALVPGELLVVDDEAETISYRLNDGSEWVDGSGKTPESARRYWHHTESSCVFTTEPHEPDPREGGGIDAAHVEEIDADEFARLSALYTPQHQGE